MKKVEHEHTFYTLLRKLGTDLCDRWRYCTMRSASGELFLYSHVVVMCTLERDSPQILHLPNSRYSFSRTLEDNEAFSVLPDGHLCHSSKEACQPVTWSAGW